MAKSVGSGHQKSRRSGWPYVQRNQHNETPAAHYYGVGGDFIARNWSRSARHCWGSAKTNGTKPSQAANSRPERKTFGSATVVTPTRLAFTRRHLEPTFTRTTPRLSR